MVHQIHNGRRIADGSDRVLFTGGAIGLELAGRGNDLNSSE
jgi:hypothetical protein